MTKAKAFYGMLLCLLIATGSGAAFGGAADDAALKQFRQRVLDYVKLHHQVESKLPAVPNRATPEQISAHQSALAAAIREARLYSNRGDIFGTAEEPIRGLIAQELKGRDGADARATVKEGNPVNEPTSGPIILAVNAAYPPKSPVSSVPPMLLLRLPPLPDELNYRFVGRALILHDTHADLIVDFMTNATPGAKSGAN